MAPSIKLKLWQKVLLLSKAQADIGLDMLAMEAKTKAFMEIIVPQ